MVANAGVTGEVGPSGRGGRLVPSDERGAPPGFDLVLDVTGIVDVARRRLTGVERVIIDGVDALDRRLATPVSLCRYDRQTRRFAAVSREEYWRCVSVLRAAGSGVRGETEAGGPAGRPAPDRPSLLARRPSRRGRLADRSSAVGIRVRELGTVASAFARVGLILGRRVAALPGVIWSELRADRSVIGRCASDDWGAGTVYCSLGLAAQWSDVTYLARRRRARGFRVVTTVHDLLGVVSPQYVFDLADVHAVELETADVVLTPSESTAADVRAFVETLDRGSPAIVALPMRSGLADESPERPELPGNVTSSIAGGFVLCVGSVTIRKNHHLLLDVWERLASELGALTPPLVIAGMEGWLSAETMARIARTPALHGIVHHVPDAGDAELVWLYRTCRLTVFPSRAEGWGIPVTESLVFGKVCLAASATSLPEAGAGLAVLLDPIDRTAWHDEVVRYWDDADDVRTRLEQRIVSEFRHPTSGHVADAILDACERARFAVSPVAPQ